MLQQILKDMWVDPAILAELDEDQKQTLFCRMREEQVRRWRLWDQKLSEQPPPPPRKTNVKKTVQFMNGEDGEPWVWVMGEHPDDPSIEHILEQEAREKARKQAEQEAQQLRRSVEEELTGLLDLNQRQIQELELASGADTGTGPGGGTSPSPPSKSLQEDEMIYCSVDELREWTSHSSSNNNKKKEEIHSVNNINHINSANVIKNNNLLNNVGNNGYSNGMNGHYHSGLNGNANNNNKNARAVPDKRDVLQEISLNNKPRVAQRVAQWERRVMETRAEQILTNLKKRQLEAAREAEEMAPQQEKLWQEQERRAKEAEQQIREIARRAREEHRRTSVLDDPSLSSPAATPTAAEVPAVPAAPLPPQSRDAVVRWYRENEEPRRAGRDAAGAPQPWFHDLISRQEAEARLASRGAGAFLVRLSERVWGYAISYRDSDRCKHYLVDTAGGSYQFLGANQICHKSLGDLVIYHREYPITQVGGERLLEPCTPPAPVAAHAPAPVAPKPKPLLPALPARPIHARPLPPLPHLRTVCARSD